ncbi:hypothetical protein JW752_04930 [Candidatus Peregrinibacteria bacterium]|nr:hypothetical protein [Candidatus Peregrinibacteria bacterium]
MIQKQLKITKWSARIIALAVILFGLPFYFGYGNPLPFINPDYTWGDNAVLTLYPLIFIGLGLGWKYEKIGGYLVTVPITIGLVLGLTTGAGFSINMLVPLIAGVLYLVAGYKKEAH